MIFYGLLEMFHMDSQTLADFLRVIIESLYEVVTEMLMHILVFNQGCDGVKMFKLRFS